MMAKSKKKTSYWFKIGEHGVMAFVLADSLEEAKNILLEEQKLWHPRKKLQWTILMKCTNLRTRNNHKNWAAEKSAALYFGDSSLISFAVALGRSSFLNLRSAVRPIEYAPAKS